MGRSLDESDRSPEFLKIGITDAAFQQAGKQDSEKHLLNSFEKIDDSSGEHFCKTLTGMLSGPQAIEESKREITLDTEAGVIRMLSNGSTCLTGISGKMQLVALRDDIDEKFLANNSALSLGEVTKSEPYKREGITDLPLLLILLKILQKSREPNFCDEIRDLMTWE